MYEIIYILRITWNKLNYLKWYYKIPVAKTEGEVVIVSRIIDGGLIEQNGLIEQVGQYFPPKEQKKVDNEE